MNSQFVQSSPKRRTFSKRGNRNWCRDGKTGINLPLKIVHLRYVFDFLMVLTFVQYGSFFRPTIDKLPVFKVSSTFTELLLFESKPKKMCLCEKESGDTLELPFFNFGKCQKIKLVLDQIDTNHYLVQSLIKWNKSLEWKKWPNF